jgi:hypothetical protein
MIYTLQFKKAFGAAGNIQNQCGGLTMTVRSPAGT